MPVSSEKLSDVWLFIPNTLRDWPWPRHINPNYAICKKESSSWLESFRPFDPKSQVAFNKCDFNLLASLAFPLLDKAGCRVGCDLMNLFFFIDEYSDLADDEGTRIVADIAMDAIRNPHAARPDGEWIGGEITRQFWCNAIRTASPSSQRRFVETFETYLDSVISQTMDRTNQCIRSVNEYFELRRDTIGAKPSFAILEHYMNIPDDVMKHPVIMKLTELCVDMIVVGNDLYSYNKEQARGDDHNLVAVVMHQFDMDVHGSFDWISQHHDGLVKQFILQWNRIPTFGGPIDREVRTYCDGLGNWVRANECWSFECERYFGEKGPSIKKSRKVKKLPFIPQDAIIWNPQGAYEKRGIPLRLPCTIIGASS